MSMGKGFYLLSLVPHFTIILTSVGCKIHRDCAWEPNILLKLGLWNEMIFKIPFNSNHSIKSRMYGSTSGIWMFLHGLNCRKFWYRQHKICFNVIICIVMCFLFVTVCDLQICSNSC